MLGLKLWHVVSVGLFAGAQLTVLTLQSLLWRSLDDAERKHLARACATAGRVLVMPVMYVAFVSGLVYWGVGYSFKGAPNIHLMLTAGFLAVGMSSMWKAQARKLSEALEKGTAFAQAKTHLEKGWIFAGLGLLFTLAAYAAAVWKMPSGG